MCSEVDLRLDSDQITQPIGTAIDQLVYWNTQRVSLPVKDHKLLFPVCIGGSPLGFSLYHAFFEEQQNK